MPILHGYPEGANEMATVVTRRLRAAEPGPFRGFPVATKTGGTQ